MKNAAFILFMIFSSTAFANGNKISVARDSILNNKIQTIQKELIEIRNKQDTFGIQKDFFIQVIDSQKSKYTDAITIMITFFSILFGVIGIVGYRKFISDTKEVAKKMTEEFNKSKLELDKKYDVLFKEQENIKLDLHQEKGNLYITHANLVGELEVKLKYILLAVNEFLLGHLFKTAQEEIEYALEIFKKLITNNESKRIYLLIDVYNDLLNELLEISNTNDNFNNNSNPNYEIIRKILKEIMTQFSKLIKS
jgi:hypothetical protein